MFTTHPDKSLYSLHTTFEPLTHESAYQNSHFSI